jgi:PAS domain S-box-containing protein
LKGDNGMVNTIDLMGIFDHDSHFQNLMKRMLENAMEHSFHGIMITKAEPGYPVIYVNDAFAEITGYSSEEIVGKSPAILQGSKTDRAVLARLNQALSEGRLFHGEAIPIKNEEEVTSHYLALQRDVTKPRDSR